MKNLKFMSFALMFLFTITSSCAQTSSELSRKTIAKATKSGDLEIIKTYLEGGADIDDFLDEKHYPYTLLCSSAKYGNTEIVKFLSEKNADLELESNQKTPLMYAAKYGQVEVVKILLEKGANAKTKSTKGRTALDYAKRKNNKEIVAILEQAMR